MFFFQLWASEHRIREKVLLMLVQQQIQVIYSPSNGHCRCKVVTTIRILLLHAACTQMTILIFIKESQSVLLWLLSCADTMSGLWIICCGPRQIMRVYQGRICVNIFCAIGISKRLSSEGVRSSTAELPCLFHYVLLLGLYSESLVIKIIHYPIGVFWQLRCSL